MFLLNKKMKSRRNGTPALVSSLLIACTIQYAPGAWAEGHIVDIEGHVDCSDGHQSDACGWDGIPDINSMDSGSRGGGGGGGGTGSSNPPTPQKRTSEQKAADVAICKEQKTDAINYASNIFLSNMNACTATNNTWYGYLHQQWLKTGLPIFGYAPADCVTVNNQAYFDVQAIIDKRYKSCSDDAMKD